MIRADVLLTLYGHTPSRTLAAKLIQEGRVFVDGAQVKKPSQPIPEFCRIEVKDSPLTRYVGRGGLKLEEALRVFSLDVGGLTCLDVGASTGGFTDCLLKHGAKKVYAVDVGTAQLHPSLRFDKRVVCMENTNAKSLRREDFDSPLALAVMDVSFVGQSGFYPVLAELLPVGAGAVTLIKPQFEVGRENVGKNGIVKNEKAVQRVVDTLGLLAKQAGFERVGLCESPITGGDGNREFLQYLRRVNEHGSDQADSLGSQRHQG